MNNKTSGNQFEAEFCDTLADEGFWTHNMAANAAGQPADVIAVKNGEAYLIDCKVCSRNRFPFTRIEENQTLSMELWRECNNGDGWFALQFSDQVYMVTLESMRNAMNSHTSLNRETVEEYGVPLGEWLWVRR